MFTTLETTVYNSLMKQCKEEEGYSSSVKEVAKDTGLDIKTVRGVVGSLIKKGRAQSDGGDLRGSTVFFDLWPIDESGMAWSNGEEW